MENGFLVYGTIAAITLGFFVFRAARNDEAYARKLAKIRVPIEDRAHKRIQENPEEDYENYLLIEWLMVGLGFILVLLFFQAL